jgi:hypothetical protein
VIPALNSRTVEPVKILVDGSASPMQIMVASRQMPLADRMQRRVQSILKGGEESESAAERLQRDADFYDVVLAALIKDNADLKIKPLDDAGARAIVEDIYRQWTERAPVRANLLDLAPHLQAANEDANKATIDCQAVILT